MGINQFLPFCPTDSGTNLLSEADYLASPDRVSGNKPGVASGKLNNRAIRQANFIAAQIAQYVSDKTGTDLLDDANDAKLLAQIKAALLELPTVVTRYLSGSGNHNTTKVFFISSGSATVGATYTNNSVTFTVLATVAAATMVSMTGNGSPSVSGTLTKASGTGDATLTFYAVRAPLSLRVRAIGAGGGGAGSGTVTGGVAVDGSDTTFGTSLIVAKGGLRGVWASNSGAGGVSGTVNSPAVAVANLIGSRGSSFFQSFSTTNPSMPGGDGGESVFGGGGKGVFENNGLPAETNSGSGGAGGGIISGVSSNVTGAGGGAGNYIEAEINDPLNTYAFVIGAGGSGGSAGTSGKAGAAGADGQAILEEVF